jgi:thiol-disulfide isomerase/thioredoxin
VVAATEEVEGEDSVEFHQTHMGEIFGDGFSFSGYERDHIKWNAGDGTFVEVSGVTGADSISDGRGTVYADFDNDGDPDIFLTTMQRKAHYLFKNNIGDGASFLRVELVGTTTGTDAFGATVTVEAGGHKQLRAKTGGGGYLSQNDDRLLFGLGDATDVDEVTVRWPNGIEESFSSIDVNKSIKITEGAGELELVETPSFAFPPSWNVAEQLLAEADLHVGDRFPDFLVQRLDGTQASVDELLNPGRRTLVNLWATWCTSCVREMPELEQMRPKLDASSVDLIGISVDLEGLDSVASYAEQLGVRYPIVMIDESGMERLFPSGEIQVPMTFLLSPDGTIEAVWAGWTPAVQRELERLID